MFPCDFILNIPCGDGQILVEVSYQKGISWEWMDVSLEADAERY